MPLRLLARAAPLVLGAVAAALWLSRRRPQRPALVAAVTPAPPPAPAPPAVPRPQSTRFVRASETGPVDIVTVVDDLLSANR